MSHMVSRRSTALRPNVGHDPHVVIVGAGFAGLAAAKALRAAPVRITVLDRTNHHLFQPLLYQVATGLLSPSDISVPTRFLLRGQRNVRVFLANVEAIDVRRKVALTDGECGEIEYDYLIVAAGARHSYFARPDWEALAPGLKTIEDAREVRHRFLSAFEEAEKSREPAVQDAWLTFVVVGGGPTGVELAGILPSIARQGFRSDFRRIDPARTRVILLEAGPRLLPTFPDALARRAQRDLERLGVDVRTGAMVTHISHDAVCVGDDCIRARTVFWAAGNAASPLIARMGVDVDRHGRAVVSPDLSLPGFPEAFVVGDAAASSATDVDRDRAAAAGTGQYIPAVAAAANQMGAHAARMIQRSLAGQQRQRFQYRDRGSLAIIGRDRAVADFGWLTLKGRLAFWVWVFVHLLYLVGFRNRVSVALEWGYAYVTYRPGARLIAGAVARRVPARQADVASAKVGSS